MNQSGIISVVLWAVLILIAFLLFVLILPIKIMAIHENDNWKIKLKILFFAIDLSHISQTGDDELQKKTAQKNKSHRKNFKIDFEGLRDICDFFGLLGTIIKTTKKIVILAIKKLTIEDLTLKITVSSENSAETAINYGRVSSIVYPIATLLFNLNRPKNYNIVVSPDFLSTKMNFYLKLCAKMRIWNLLVLVIEILRSMYKNEVILNWRYNTYEH